jgi:hypothetical protein
MRTRDLCWGLILLAGCSFHADCGGKKTIKAREVEKTLQSQPTEGVTFTKVTCPDDVEVKVDATFDCQIEVDGKKTYPLHITITAVEGTKFTYTNAWPKPVISEKVIRDKFAAPIAQELGVPVTVECGEPLREIVDGKATCDATVGTLKTKFQVAFDDKLSSTGASFVDSFYTTPKVASIATPAVQQQLGAETVVDCGPPDAKPRPADGIITCNVTKGADKGLLKIEVDADMNLGNWKVEPVK